MIFVGGIHGVGKSFFCERLSELLNIPHYSSSELISTRKEQKFSSNKEIKEINQNQSFLFDALNALGLKGKNFLLDGHFCLISEEGAITRIQEETFYELAPNSIVLLKCPPELIAERLLKRDGKVYCIEFLNRFQQEEFIYAKSIAAQLVIPFHVVDHHKDKLETLVQKLN